MPANRRSSFVSRHWSDIAVAAAALLVFVGYIAVELRRNGALGFPLDDSWIHLTFARNLAQGRGFVFNPGEPVAGSTAPLWTLLLAFFHILFRSASAMVWVAKALGLVFLCVGGLFAPRIAQNVTQNRWAGLGAGLAVVTLCHLDWGMVSGLEMTLSAALTLAAIHYYLESVSEARSPEIPSGREIPRKRSFVVPWVLLGLSVYARPESFLLLGLVTFDALLRKLWFKQKVTYWRGLAVYVVTVLPYFMLNYTLSHSPFPMTYLAKASRISMFTALAIGKWNQVRLLLTRAPWFYFREFSELVWQANPVLAILTGVGVVALVIQAIRVRAGSSLLLPLVALLYVPLMGVFVPFTGPGFQNGRYVGNIVAVAALVAVIATALGLRLIRNRGARYAVGATLAVLAGFNTVSTGIASSGNVARAESSINRTQVDVGRWLHENAPAEAVVACNDIGAIGYFGQRRVLDLMGLVTPEIIPHRRQQAPGQENLAAQAFIREKKPDYVAIFPAWFPFLKDEQYLEPVHVIDLPDNTVTAFDVRPQTRTFAGILVLDLPVIPQRTIMAVFRCNWPGEQ